MGEVGLLIRLSIEEGFKTLNKRLILFLTSTFANPIAHHTGAQAPMKEKTVFRNVILPLCKTLLLANWQLLELKRSLIEEGFKTLNKKLILFSTSIGTRLHAKSTFANPPAHHTGAQTPLKERTAFRNVITTAALPIFSS